MASEQAPVEMPATFSKYTKRVMLKTILGRTDGGVGLVGQRVVIGGWVKSSREIRKQPVTPPPAAPAPPVVSPKDVTCSEVFQSRIPLFRSIMKVFGAGEYRIREKLDVVVQKAPQPSVSILQVSDGSCVASLQVLVDSALANPCQVMPTGTCVLIEGVLQQPSVQGKHYVELQAEKILHLGLVDESKYPLSKKRLPLESLRDCSHFRPRTTTVASVMRIHNSLTWATHAFFQDQGFLHVQVPIITSTDSEGFSEKFLVTTLLSKGIKDDQISPTEHAGVSVEAIRASMKEKTKKVEELSRTNSNKEALVAAQQDLKKTNELVSQLEARQKAKSGVTIETRKFDFSKDFFTRQTYLTVSGRLHLESQACALGNVYSFGPRFKAEKLESKKSLAETWMIDVEMAFSELEDAMDCANDFLKFVCKRILEGCMEDLQFVLKRIDKSVMERLQFTISSSFVRISYAEAIEILRQVAGKKFQSKIELGVSLTEEHESYLVDEIYKKTVIVYNHPKELKPFYVRLNDDGKTVATFDVILPKVGALIRGSQSEERFNVLSSRMKELGLQKQQYEWYLDLRRHGSAKTSGFSLMLEPLVLYATGLNDVKDVVPFARSFGRANN
ncbi:PREDICTED: asparagine--tRNA ligase, cytoplasmic 2 [Nicotiana attenuata]|uniref:asparagine--tRNA ligase n=1 Tax=Nicotiana attenuata TaxID=49451 RepID=A0A314LE04_NICAT|nr:PREDICTED: asparagine--tRNA ligase, cytoplasmic 2 [Nicotiana attenuata]OIT38874.1 asparagine--trna ligase, cytoplasmic 2 [Nicotiana attenuata]